MKFIGTLTVFIGLVLAHPVAASAESCPLAQKSGIDYDCSVTLTVDVMANAAPNNILSRPASENMKHEKEHADNVVKAGPGSKAWAYIKNRVQQGQKWVDGKKAAPAGKWLKDWFHKRFAWAFIRQHRKAIAGACVGSGLAAYAIGKEHGESHLAAGHDAIDACVAAAAGTAGAYAIGGS